MPHHTEVGNGVLPLLNERGARMTESIKRRYSGMSVLMKELFSRRVDVAEALLWDCLAANSCSSRGEIGCC